MLLVICGMYSYYGNYYDKFRLKLYFVSDRQYGDKLIHCFTTKYMYRNMFCSVQNRAHYIIIDSVTDPYNKNHYVNNVF